MQPVQQPIRPSRVWYLVAGVLAVGAVVWLVAGVVLGLGSFVRQVEGFQRVPVPGQGEVSFEQPGGYPVYYEGPAAGDETVAIPSFRLSLAPVGGGQELTVSPYEGASLYTSGSYSGRAVGTVQVDRPGRFLLRADGEPQVVQAHVAVGQEIGGFGLLRAVPIVLLLLFGGMVLAVVVAVRRQQARQARPTLATWGQRTLPAGWLADPASAMSFATGMASGGPSMSPIAEPMGSIPCEHPRRVLVGPRWHAGATLSDRQRWD